jgi:hypothetical protein
MEDGGNQPNSRGVRRKEGHQASHFRGCEGKEFCSYRRWQIIVAHYPFAYLRITIQLVIPLRYRGSRVSCGACENRTLWGG